MSALVYQAINAIAAELAQTGIAKTHSNEEGEYRYRSIEDVLAALAPLLARHRLCVLPRMREREALGCGKSGQLVIVRAAFDLVSALDGSKHTIESFGEALDESDKGSAKAMSAAYKAAMLQAFCIPVPQEDADARSPALGRPGSSQTVNKPTTGATANRAVAGAAANRSVPGATALPEPVEGWVAWAGEVIAIAESCETAEAIDRLTASRRQLFAALQRARPDLYAKAGEAIAARLAGLQQPAAPAEAPVSATAVASAAGTAPRTGKRKPRKESADAAAEPAEAA